MKITVLGCGALGQLWLSALYKKGHDVQGWLRVSKPYCSVNLIGRDGSLFSRLIAANNLDFLARCDLLLVTLKAWQASAAVRKLSVFLPKTSPILLFHNGMGTVDELKGVVQPIIISTTTHAIKRNNSIVIHVASGTTHMGPTRKLRNNYSYLADILHAALPNTFWHETIKPYLWYKLAANCVINPLTALWNCSNGALLNHFQEISTLCSELAKVITYEGLHTSVEDLLNYIEEVITNTAENTSSMLQDVRNSRRTEIDYISGYLLKRAFYHKINVPKNAKLYNLVKHKESEYVNND